MDLKKGGRGRDPESAVEQTTSAAYEAIQSLNERREPIDFVTLTDELERNDRLNSAGGPAYITDLISMTPTAICVDHYARIVERGAIRGVQCEEFAFPGGIVG